VRFHIDATCRIGSSINDTDDTVVGVVVAAVGVVVAVVSVVGNTTSRITAAVVGIISDEYDVDTIADFVVGIGFSFAVVGHDVDSSVVGHDIVVGIAVVGHDVDSSVVGHDTASDVHRAGGAHSWRVCDVCWW